MRLRTLGIRAGGFAAAALRLACLARLAAATEPYGPIAGGRLRGERASGSVRDWSFLEPRYRIEIQTHALSLLPSARARCVPSPERLSGTQIRHWLYRVDPVPR